MKIFCLFLISIPLISLAGILWEDDFESYQVGTDLDDSPYWEKLNPEYRGFKVYYHNQNDKWVQANIAGIYIASGGASDPDMKVSAKEVYVPTDGESHVSYVGIFTRLSYDGKGYGVIYGVQHGDYYDYFYKIIVVGTEWHTYPHSNRVKSISITASGDNPVHLSIWLDDYNLTYDDYKYNITGGYGGIYARCSMNGMAGLDDFFEETYGTSVLPTSIGVVKALFR